MPRSWKLLTALFLAIVAFVGVVSYTLNNLARLDRTITIRPLSRGVYAVGQAPERLGRLLDALRGYQLGVVDADHVALQVDLLWSRLDVLQHGQINKLVDVHPGYADLMADFDVALGKLDVLFETIDVNRAKRAEELLRPLYPRLREVLITATQQATADRGAERDAAVSLISVTRYLVALASACLVVIAGLLIRQTVISGREARARRASEERYELAVRGTHDGIWDWDIRSGAVYFSPRLEKILGLSPGALGTDIASFDALVHSDDLERRQKLLAEHLAEDTPYEISFRVRHGNGSWIWVRSSGQVHRDAAGEPVRMVGALSDITESKRVEAELRTSEERLRQAAHLANIGYYIWDAVEDRCIFCSKQHAAAHGLTVEEYISHAPRIDEPFEIVHVEDRERVQAEIRALRGGKRIELEYRVVTPEGETRYLREVAEPTVDETGRVVLETGASQEITELKKAEEQLRQAQKMEAIGQLTGGLAHDFNNLLTVIQGNVELLEDSDEEGETPVDAIHGAVERGAELTQRLLAFSRRQSLQPRSIDVGQLVRDMHDLLARTLGETIVINISGGPGLWRAAADPGQVENALLNLALNARDAMPGGGRLSITCSNAHLDQAYADRTADAIPGDYVLLAVSDNGTGMSRAVREHVFEPFFTTKEVGAGSGLGLSMVYGFAKQSGGHVSIYSEVDQGTSVKLYLPRDRTAAKDVKRSKVVEVPKGRGERVLVLEDDSRVRRLAVRMLGELGYAVAEAADATAARALLDEGQRFDLVLSDVVLPGGISGPDFALEAAADDPDLRFVFMSGYPAEAAVGNGLIGAGSILLDKPFRRQKLASAVRETLDRA